MYSRTSVTISWYYLPVSTVVSWAFENIKRAAKTKICENAIFLIEWHSTAVHSDFNQTSETGDNAPLKLNQNFIDFE